MARCSRLQGLEGRKAVHESLVMQEEPRTGSLEVAVVEETLCAGLGEGVDTETVEGLDDLLVRQVGRHVVVRRS